MSEKYSFLVIKYPKADTAMEAMAALRGLSKDKVVKLKDAVAITKTQKGKIKLHQTKDDAAGKGFVKGGLVGILLAGSTRTCRLGCRWRADGHCFCNVRPGDQE